MTKAWTIVGTMLGGSEELPILQIDGDPEPVMQVLRRLPAGRGRHGKNVRKYDWVRALRNDVPAEAVDASTSTSSR